MPSTRRCEASHLPHGKLPQAFRVASSRPGDLTVLILPAKLQRMDRMLSRRTAAMRRFLKRLCAAGWRLGGELPVFPRAIELHSPLSVSQSWLLQPR
jgi:hypothetical protein